MSVLSGPSSDRTFNGLCVLAKVACSLVPAVAACVYSFSTGDYEHGFFVLLYVGLGFFMLLIIIEVVNEDSTDSNLEENARLRPLESVSGAVASEKMRKHFEMTCPRMVWGDSMQVDSTVGYGRERTCTICFEPLTSGEECRLLTCQHAYHTICIDAWWVSRADRRMMCAICRQETKHASISKGALANIEF